jgi:glyoxylase-like metal-dependent hydrolase (beta-lactamase superfamily II)
MSRATSVFVGAVGIAITIGIGLAQQPTTQQGPAQQTPPVTLQVHQLTPSVYWVQGGGGNSGVVVGQHGVIVIDAKVRPELGKQLVDDIAQITPKPITTVIITHSHIDHVGGLPDFPKGITIMAHENALKELQANLSKGGPGAPSPDSFPNKIISRDKEDLTIDGTRLELLHWGPGHTSGDIVVFLLGEKLVFTGDLIEGNRFRPEIEPGVNGVSEGWISNVKGMLALDATQYVSGHAGVLDREAVRKYLNDVENERAAIVKLVAGGESLQQVQAAVGDPPPNAPNGYGTRFPAFSEVVYRELTTKTAP